MTDLKYILVVAGNSANYFFQSLKDATKMIEKYKSQGKYTYLYQLVMEDGELIDAKRTKI